MKNIILIAIFHLITIQLPFCGQTEEPVLVNTEWLAGNIRDPFLVILHAASVRDDYRREHIPGARFLWNGWVAESNPERSYELPEAGKLDTLFEGLGISDDSKIVIYSDLQDAAAAARAYLTLEYLGMGPRTSILNGGFEKWKRDGRPVTAEIPQFKRGKLSPLLKSDVFVNAHEISIGLKSADLKIVDGRSKQSYNGGGTGVFRPGHIAGAVNIPSTSIIDSAGCYLPADSLRRLFTAAGINPGDRIVVYCYSGRSAAPVYIAAKLLNHPVSLYDGSFEEWSRKPELPVESGKSVH